MNLPPSAAFAQSHGRFNLVVLGDSLTAGYGLGLSQAFPAVLQRALSARGWNVTVINAGVSGDTASDGLARVDWSVGHDADAAIVELGANDMLRGIDPGTTKKALAGILARLRQRNLPTMLAGMYASPSLGPAYVARFQKLYLELAKAYHVPLYPFFLKGVVNAPDLEQADGMHPNVRGVEVIVTAILPAVESFLSTTSAKRSR